MEHITRLSLSLVPESRKSFSAAHAASFGPMLQGALMENVDGAYADSLHVSAFHPYSQYCVPREGGGVAWVINALKDEAAEHIVNPLSKVDSVVLRGVGEKFTVERKTMESIPVNQLLARLQDDCAPKRRIRFLTPTAFKTRGEYAIMPNARLVFQNLLMRYNQVYAGEGEVDEETILYMEQHTKITAYNLRSRYFSHSAGKAKIPAFVGDVSFGIAGAQSMRGLAGMLFCFGEYAGVGIKASMGMGAMREVPSSEAVRIIGNSSEEKGDHIER